jgi:magnesium transporter
VDITDCGDEAVASGPTSRTGILAVRDCMQRNRVPRVRIYPYQRLAILHATE